MQYLRYHRCPLVWLLLMIVMSWQVSCTYYQRYPMTKARMPKIDTRGLTFYLIDVAHPLSKVWYITDYNISEQYMSAFIVRMSETEAMQVSTVRNNRDARASRNEVLLYAKPKYALGLPDTLTTRIDFDQLEKIEVHEVNYGRVLAFNILGYIGIGMLISLIALAAKGSCPFVYAYNPDGTYFQGELYSGCTYPQLERHDWLPLPDLVPNQGDYQIRLANKAKEIQHTNLLELLAVDHPANTEVLFDKNGQLQTLQKPQTPRQALDFEGHDVLEKLSDRDSLLWHGDAANTRPRADEGLVLTFRKPAGARSAKLAIRAKNTFWMDYMYGLFLDEFGEYSQQVRQQYLQKSAGEIRQWMDEQNVPLRVAIETAPDQWQQAGFFHLAGPMALKNDVLALDLSAVPGDEVRIRLESGFMFWEIDWVARDFSAPVPVTVQKMLPTSAPNQMGQDVAAALARDDDQYYSQPNLNDEAMVHYAVPAQAPGTVRSLLLHAKGHYEILRDPVPGKPSLLYLRHFQEPDALGDYSRFRWRELMEGKGAEVE
ncbi:MAG: hypothetical protein LH618_08455 [Saprospiraceae bacterium]|nr:hypothetical protein [Saprospiraceae bacterium]